MTIDDFLQTRYVKFGRGPVDMDCWGLVRLARVELFSKALLPSYADVDPHDKRRLTQSTHDAVGGNHLVEVDMMPGAIAAAWQARLCVHVGIVVESDGRLWILETDEDTGPVLTRPSTFESRYTKVVYYDN